MTVEPDEYEQLAKEIQNLIKENKKFLERVRQEDFEPECGEDEQEDSPEDFEEL
ncbi:MAG TPA: hypothetical protein PLI53_02635 [Geobacteraceae bacterium]|nr:hypothetical protein [Geobacteraceae bacterium]